MTEWSQRILREWTQRRFGPLHAMQRVRLGPPDPPWWVCTTALARTPIGNRYSADPTSGSGSSLDPDEALWRALGEGIERYSARTVAFATVAATLRETEIAARLPICAPDEPCLPSFRTLPLDTPLMHVAVRRLADHRETLIPAGFVHLNVVSHDPEPPVTIAISTGLAFHTTLLDALWTGWCEVVERDAMMGMWWCETPLREIVCESATVPDALGERLEHFRHAGLDVHLFDMTTDVRVPSVFCVVTAAQYPYLLVSAACHSDPLRACTKTLDEIAGSRYALRLQSGEAQTPVVDPGDVHQLEDHLLFYAHAPMHPAFAFLLAPAVPHRVSFHSFARGPWWEKPRDLASLAQFAAEREREGLTILWADVTAPEVADIGRVVKVVVPEMIPLSPDHAVRWLATPRLRQRAGGGEAGMSAFHPFPHPFP